MPLGAWVRVLQRQSGPMWSLSLCFCSPGRFIPLFFSLQKWFQASRSTGQKMATPLLPNYISSIQVTNQVKRQQHLNSWEDLICWIWVQLVGVREQGICSDNATFAANRMQASLEGSYGLGRWLHHYSSLLSFPCHPIPFILFILFLKSSKVLMPCGTNKARMPFPSLETTVP